MKIAFIGLGNMGAAMATCLQGAGHCLHVWNRTPAKADILVGKGAILATTPEEAVSAADFVFSSLMDDTSVNSIFAPGTQTFAALAQGSAHVSLTTISPGCADALEANHKARGCFFVSGPVFGRPDMAAAGKLLQILAGDEEVIERVKPICATFAERTIVVPGSAGAANRQKLCMNFAVIAFIEAMAESYTFAEKSGASREIMAHLFDHAFAHPGLKQYAQRLYQKNTDGRGGFAMKAGAKDVGMMRDEALRHGIRLGLADIVAAKMEKAIAQGMGEQDWSAIHQIYEEPLK